MNYPSVPHAEAQVHFWVFIIFGEVKQTNAFECLFCVLTKLKIKQLFKAKNPPRTLGTYASLPCLQK